MRDRRRYFGGVIVFITTASMLFFSVAAHAQKRVALVVGNGTYQKVPVLPNPPNDATDVAASLDRLGFTVKLLTNASFDEFRRALLEFGRRARGAEMAVLFYAGHGMEVGGENWLIPTDAELRIDSDAENEAVSLRTVMLQVGGASDLGLVILDACRNNPFAAKMQRTVRTRAVDQGLVRTEPTENVLVAYAAKDGTTANDGAGRNSPFTTALLKSIETPGLEITFMFRNVRDEVMAATRREQQPFVYGSLSRRAIYLKEAPSVADAVLPATPLTSTPGPPLMTEAAHAWAAVKDSTSPAMLETYVKRFGDSFYADLARGRIDELRRPATVVPAPPTKEARLVDPAEASRRDLVTDCDRLAGYPMDPQRPRTVPGVEFNKIDIMPALAACNDALRQYPDVARFSFQAGRVADAQMDFQRARQYYERAVGLGSTTGMTGVGNLYLNGNGVPKDYQEARRWLEKSAAVGEPNAMNGLGYIYMNGSGVPKDDYEARKWFEKAAAAGNVYSMTTLGSFYQNGRAGLKNYAEARRWYEKAAAMGNGEAMYNIGTLYQNGTGVKKNVSEARRWYEKADAAGVQLARKTLKTLR